MATITMIKDFGTGRKYRIEDGRGYCEFTIYNQKYPGRRALASFGGSVWPGAFPEVFEHFGDKNSLGGGVINHRSGYMVREEVELPTA